MRGWGEKSPKRIEFYCALLNHLAEDIHIPSIHTEANLAEALGYLHAENNRLCQHMATISQKLITTSVECLKCSS